MVGASAGADEPGPDIGATGADDNLGRRLCGTSTDRGGMILLRLLLPSSPALQALARPASIVHDIRIPSRQTRFKLHLDGCARQMLKTAYVAPRISHLLSQRSFALPLQKLPTSTQTLASRSLEHAHDIPGRAVLETRPRFIVYHPRQVPPSSYMSSDDVAGHVQHHCSRFNARCTRHIVDSTTMIIRGRLSYVSLSAHASCTMPITFRMLT